MIDSTTVTRTAECKGPAILPASLGALIAAAICAVVALVGGLIQPPEGVIVGLIGLPGTTWLAYRLAPAIVVADRRTALKLALILAVRAVLIGDAIVVAAIGLWTLPQALGTLLAMSDPGSMLAYAITGPVVFLALGVLLFLFGLVFFGLPAIAICIPAAIVWAGVVRAVGSRRPA